MLAVHKPPPAHFAPPLFRPTHSRHPTAPVVIKPTHTPGLLTLSKPVPPVPRPQTAHQRERQGRSSPRGKKSSPAQQAPVRTHAVEDNKPSGSPTKSEGVVSDKPKVQPGLPVAADKSARGRQPSKPTKEKAQRRSASSCSRVPARRPAHQPSPPPADRIPSQAEASVQRPTKSIRPSQSTSVSGLNDPFAVFESTTDAAPKESAKAGSKGQAFRPAPPLAQPSGKLARRRQLNAHASSSPSAIKNHHQRKDRVAALVGSVTEDMAKLSMDDDVSTTPVKRSKALRAAQDWPLFPVCDDSSEADESDDTPPTTPLRESASVPPKKHLRAWPVSGGVRDVPHTAPLSSTFVFPFVPSPSSSPTPAQRRRHRRVPSEGVFHMSMDEDSSSSSSEFPSTTALHPRSRRPAPSPREAIAGEASSAPQAGFFAGSAFQNSPSPDELPPPAF